MKVADTTPGKSYSVHSSAGCTVSDDSGWSKTLEAPEDYFTAHTSKVYIDDDAATMRVLFKLAPQQRLTLLGVLGGDKLPYGYTRLEYLESTGTQYIDTLLELTNNHSVELTSQMTKADVVSCTLFGAQVEGNQQNYAFSLYQKTSYEVTRLLWFFYKTTSIGLSYDDIPGINAYDKMQISIDGGVLRINGRYITTGDSGEFSTGRTCWIFDRNSYTNPIGFYGKMFNFKVNRGGPVLNLLPALDHTGTPCMYDTVTKTPFRNSGTGAFIAGIETQKQLDAMLRRLPDRTGQDVSTLQVRLADELQTPENEAKLDAMLAKNWEISQAA